MGELRAFSASEVSLHSSKNDCWLIIGGKVYDVTGFLEEHPGGDDVLIKASEEGDATEAFEEVGHSSTATSMLTSYQVGVIDGSTSGEADKPRAKEQEQVFVPAKRVEAGPPPSPFSGLSHLLVPLLVLGLALGALYLFNRGSS
ncbi:hypothetical protein H6P81_011926 [Aristolochia fimbriata]|uniref:Cytochrome b5 heme-binding domain-containing protein n=1 Tax=Aristolochia fimbriata TaxID=158543 RepID=A0AAV7EAQ0_ARIFI|nr:hypothetical protein H6P81_011926 [Aristolochia fimbriata]